MELLKPPRELNMGASNLPQECRQWKETFTLYVDLAMDGTKEDKVKVKMFLYLVGTRGREYKTIEPTEEKLDKVLDAFETYCNPPKN